MSAKLEKALAEHRARLAELIGKDQGVDSLYESRKQALGASFLAGGPTDDLEREMSVLAARKDGIHSALDTTRKEIARLEAELHGEEVAAARASAEAACTEIEQAAYLVLQTMAAAADEWPAILEKMRKVESLASSFGLEDVARRVGIFRSGNPYERIVGDVQSWRMAWRNPFYQAAGIVRKQ